MKKKNCINIINNMIINENKIKNVTEKVYKSKYVSNRSPSSRIKSLLEQNVNSNINVNINKENNQGGNNILDRLARPVARSGQRRVTLSVTPTSNSNNSNLIIKRAVVDTKIIDLTKKIYPNKVNLHSNNTTIETTQCKKSSNNVNINICINPIITNVNTINNKKIIAQGNKVISNMNILQSLNNHIFSKK